MKKESKTKRNPVAKELFVNAKFKHKAERSYKERIQIQNEEELEQEKREYLSGKTTTD